MSPTNGYSRRWRRGTRAPIPCEADPFRSASARLRDCAIARPARRDGVIRRRAARSSARWRERTHVQVGARAHLSHEPRPAAESGASPTVRAVRARLRETRTPRSSDRVTQPRCYRPLRSLRALPCLRDRAWQIVQRPSGLRRRSPRRARRIARAERWPHATRLKAARIPGQQPALPRTREAPPHPAGVGALVASSRAHAFALNSVPGKVPCPAQW